MALKVPARFTMLIRKWGYRKRKTCMAVQTVYCLLTMALLFTTSIYAQQHAEVTSTTTNLQTHPSEQSERFCRYRDKTPYPQTLFPLVAAWGCYNYRPDSSFQPERKLKISQFVCSNRPQYSSYQCPCFRVDNGSRVMFFNHTDRDVRIAIAGTFMTEEDEQKWLECCQASVRCCDRIAVADTSPTGVTCPATWDGWHCWDEAPANTTQIGSCPRFIYSGSGPTCIHASSKRCLGNSTWNTQTDYTACARTAYLRTRALFHIYVLSLPFITLVPAAVIFLYYRQLRVARHMLHCALVLSLIFRNLMTILYKGILLLNNINTADTRMNIASQNGAWCRVLMTFEKFSATLVFTCMLLEALYLHRVLARAFKGEPSMAHLVVIGICVSLLPTIVWSICMVVWNDTQCWMKDNNTNFHWINDAPRLAIIAINTLLLLDVIRVLLTTLRRVHTDNSLTIRRTAKATLMLFPVFGLHFLCTMFQPDTESCDGEQAYYFTSFLLQSLQGIAVPCLYCFFNNEVSHMLKKTWYEAKVKMDCRFPLRTRRGTDQRTISSALEPSLPSSRRPSFNPGRRPSTQKQLIATPNHCENVADLEKQIDPDVDTPMVDNFDNISIGSGL